MIAFLVTLAVLILIMALIYWVLGQFPVPDILVKVWLVVCVVVLILFVLNSFGLLSGITNVQLK